MNIRPGMFDNWMDLAKTMLLAETLGCIGWLVIGMMIFLIWVLIATV